MQAGLGAGEISRQGQVQEERGRQDQVQAGLGAGEKARVCEYLSAACRVHMPRAQQLLNNFPQNNNNNNFDKIIDHQNIGKFCWRVIADCLDNVHKSILFNQKFNSVNDSSS